MIEKKLKTLAVYKKKEGSQDLELDVTGDPIIVDDSQCGFLEITLCSFQDRSQLAKFFMEIFAVSSKDEKVEDVTQKALIFLLTKDDFLKFIHEKLFPRCLWNKKRLKFPDLFDEEENAEREYMEIVSEVIQANLPLWMKGNKSL